ncbi:MAG: hypothetical protein VX044_01100 [Planctomycetota bacterium]|nr:hypothetical protein [Planctomycetota bacterium]
MFVDAVWAHLLVFAVGQLFAWRYAQTGRFWLGAGVTIVLWAAADWWLVSRYLLAVEASRQAPPLLLLQVAAVTTSCAYLWALMRRWRGARGRGDGHRSAVAALLRGDREDAVKGYRKLVWSDCWDAIAWLGLGDALRRGGATGKARRCYRRAGAVDVAQRHQDLVAHRLALLSRQCVGQHPVTSNILDPQPIEISGDRKSMHSKRSAG